MQVRPVPVYNAAIASADTSVSKPTTSGNGSNSNLPQAAATSAATAPATSVGKAEDGAHDILNTKAQIKVK